MSQSLMWLYMHVYKIEVYGIVMLSREEFYGSSFAKG